MMPVSYANAQKAILKEGSFGIWRCSERLLYSVWRSLLFCWIQRNVVGRFFSGLLAHKFWTDTPIDAIWSTFNLWFSTQNIQRHSDAKKPRLAVYQPGV